MSLGLGLGLGLGRVASLFTPTYSFTGAALPAPFDGLTRGGLGTRIDSAGLVGYGPHNLAAGSGTQSIATLAQQYTMRFSGAGTVTLSGTATGTLSAGDTTVTCTAGTLTLTVSGTVTGLRVCAGPSIIGDVSTASAAKYLLRQTHDPVTHSALGLLVERQATNEISQHSLASPQMVTQTITVTAAQRTLSFYGTGTVTLTGAHAATVVGTGAYPTHTTLTFTPSAGSLTLTVSGTVQFPQLETGPVATSYIPNPTTGSMVRMGDSGGGLLTGDALASVFPQGWTHSGVIVIRKSYILWSDEVVLSLCAGSSFGPTNGLAVVINGSYVAIAAANAGASASGLLTNGSPNTIRYSVDAAAGKASISVNGGAAVEATGLTFTGVGTTHLVIGALTTSGTSAIRQTSIESWHVVQGQYLTGAALQALSA